MQNFMMNIAKKVLLNASGSVSRNVTRYIVPLGSLTGSAIATELSYQLTLHNGNWTLCQIGNCEVLTTILHDPVYYLNDQIVANVHLYADQQRKWQPQEDGQHLIQIWNDLNYQPYKDLDLQDRKTLDRFRAARTQWQVILSYADYSSKSLLGRLMALSKLKSLGMVSSDCVNHYGLIASPLTIIYGNEFLNDVMMNKYFELQKMRGIIADATKGGMDEKVIDGGNQALLSQNVTIVADIIMEKLGYSVGLSKCQNSY